LEAIELIGAPQSVYVRTTRMALEEKGVAYTLTAARPNSARVNALHPFGKIPVMRHGDFTLFESKAIATYIDLGFEGPALIPRDAKSAALVEQWVSAVNTSIFPTMVIYMQANAFPKGPDGHRDEGVVAETMPKISLYLGILNKAVGETGYFAGNSFSLADMYLMPLLGYLRLFPESSALLRSADHLVQYLDTHSSRESFVKTSPPALEELRRHDDPSG
jgi:glutathione S-transferase